MLKAKLKRTLTCLLPISKRRRGACKRCGACCKLPNTCAFLKFDKHGKSLCTIYKLRPPNCRKYPRTEKEHLTKKTCGFWFEKTHHK